VLACTPIHFLDPDALHAAERRAFVRPIYDVLEGFLRPEHYCLHRAIDTIANPTGQSLLTRLLLESSAVTHALHDS
jgi:hypothetical protein